MNPPSSTRRSRVQGVELYRQYQPTGRDPVIRRIESIARSICSLSCSRVLKSVGVLHL